MNVKCHLWQCDFSQSHHFEKALSDLTQQVGTIDCLINNASAFIQSQFDTLTINEFDRDFNIHLKNPLFLSQAFAKNCSNGQIVMMLDTRINTQKLDHFSYTLSKKSLADATKLLANDCAPSIRVNGICPGPILPAPGQSIDVFNQKCDLLPLQKPGCCAAIVHGIDYLISAEFVTGQLLFIDGGEHLGTS